MNKILTALLVSISFSLCAQFYVLPAGSNLRKMEWPDGQWEKFKKSTTIFVFTDAYELSVYEKILRESWTVTPYLLMREDNLNSSDLTKKGYSFAFPKAILKTNTSTDVSTGHTSSSSRLFFILQIGLFDSDAIITKMKRMKNAKKQDRINALLQAEYEDIAGIYLYQNSEMTEKVREIYKDANVMFNNEKEEDRLRQCAELMYSDVNYFYNYSPGLLKNYLGQISQLIEKKALVKTQEEIEEPELKDLSQETLYVPDFSLTRIKKKFNALTQSTAFFYEPMENEDVQKLFSKYPNEYEVISRDDLDEKIAAGEKFYYLRHTRLSLLTKEMVFEIVRGSDGKVIYRDALSGDNWKAAHMNYLLAALKRAK